MQQSKRIDAILKEEFKAKFDISVTMWEYKNAA